MIEMTMDAKHPRPLEKKSTAGLAVAPREVDEAETEAGEEPERDRQAAAAHLHVRAAPAARGREEDAAARRSPVAAPMVPTVPAEDAAERVVPNDGAKDSHGLTVAERVTSPPAAP